MGRERPNSATRSNPQMLLSSAPYSGTSEAGPRRHGLQETRLHEGNVDLPQAAGLVPVPHGEARREGRKPYLASAYDSPSRIEPGALVPHHAIDVGDIGGRTGAVVDE